MLSSLKMPWDLLGSIIEGKWVIWNTMVIYSFFNKIETFTSFGCFPSTNRLQCCYSVFPSRSKLPGVAVALLFAAPSGQGGAVPVFGLNLLCLLSWKQLDVRHWLSSAGTGVRPSRNSIQCVHVHQWCLWYWSCIPTFLPIGLSMFFQLQPSSHFLLWKPATGFSTKPHQGHSPNKRS